MRNYFSTQLLWAAEHNADLARQIEEAHDGAESRFDMEHRCYVLASIVTSAAFLEALINELFQDAYDEHGTSGDGYIAPIAEDARRRMSDLWRNTDFGRRLETLAKFDLALSAAGLPSLDPGGPPYQAARLLVQLRNAIVHYRPEDLSADDPHAIEKRLRHRFPDNALMAGSGNPWWPDHCLGAGCATWACTSALALADHVGDALAIRPNYKRHRESGWFGRREEPKEREG
jgi:hypothetical protein